MNLADHINDLVLKHGSLRAAALALKMDHAYLSRLASGEKDNPTAATLHKLGLRKVVHYTYSWPAKALKK